MVIFHKQDINHHLMHLSMMLLLLVLITFLFLQVRTLQAHSISHRDTHYLQFIITVVHQQELQLLLLIHKLTELIVQLVAEAQCMVNMQLVSLLNIAPINTKEVQQLLHIEHLLKAQDMHQWVVQCTNRVAIQGQDLVQLHQEEVARLQATVLQTTQTILRTIATTLLNE